MSDKRDYYEVLGVSKDSSDKEIKTAYRKQAIKYHPDKNPDDPESEDKFKECAEAYEVLSNTEKKDNYDTHGFSGPQRGGMSGFDMNDIFSQFGERKQSMRIKRGQNLRLNISLSLEDIYSGITKKFKYNRMTSCEPCSGHGGTGSKTCGTCKGAGAVIAHQQTAFGLMQSRMTCPECDGERTTIEVNCTTCVGLGVVEEEATVDVTIPHGIKNGEGVGIAHMGHAIKGGVYGELHVIITQNNHKQYTRNVNDLRCKTSIPYHDLVLGVKLDVNTIEGKTIRVTIPKFSKVGDNLRIQSKGMKISESNVRGDMILELEVDIPTEISDEEKELLEKLKKIKK